MSCGPRHDAAMRRMVAEHAGRERQRQLWAAAMSGAVTGAVNGARGVPPRNPQVRIGDADREQAVAALGEHFAAGRLSRDEFDERSDAAWSARTAADLGPLFTDLPSLSPPAPPQRSRRPAQRQAWRLGFALWWVFLLVMVLAMAGQVPWFAVAIFAGLWWTGVFSGLHRWVHRR